MNIEEEFHFVSQTKRMDFVVKPSPMLFYIKLIFTHLKKKDGILPH